MNIPALMDADGRLTFVAAEIRKEPAETPTSLIVLGAAAANGEPVGLSFELARLTGGFAVHPFRLQSIGAPTEELLAVLAKKKPGPPKPWHADGFASAAWRETSTRTPIHFRPADLTWEAARFDVQLTVGNTRCDLELELQLDSQRFSLKPRVLRDLVGVLEAARAAVA